jgi:gliding motility-associated-like protein
MATEHFLKNFLVFIFASACSTASFSQITVNSNLSPQQIVQDYLLGGGVTVSNVVYTGSATFRGVFQGTSNLGMTEGIILASGMISNAVGPNNDEGISDSQGLPGDHDLNAIIGDSTNDAAVLEFDFIPASDTISFNFVFGSDEYAEFVNQFNDVFAFLLSGPDPAGGNYFNTNIALLPDTNIPVSINNINNGTTNSGPCINCAYYVNNTAGTTIQYDGFTTVLKAVAPVIRCSTYHIKIAIADAVDDAYDSGVFLEAKSFSSPSVNMTAISNLNDSLMVEGCGTAAYVFTRSGSNSNPYTIHYAIGGTATNGTDYQDMTGQPIKDSIVFPAGVDTVSLNINAVQDGISEPNETITLAIYQLNSCTGDTLESTILIRNVDPLQVYTAGDSVICNMIGESATVFAITNGGYGPFTYAWSPVTGSSSSILVSPQQTTTYYVTVTDSCGSKTASTNFTVEIVCPVEIPNVITPNGDDYNDLFYIKNLDGYPGSNLNIYNRWGKKIFESSDYRNDWDGSGHADGTYFYVLRLSDGQNYQGVLTILKN